MIQTRSRVRRPPLAFTRNLRRALWRTTWASPPFSSATVERRIELLDWTSNCASTVQFTLPSRCRNP